jgi:GGDEF domain-containing protein
MPLISIKHYLEHAPSSDYRPTLDLLAATVSQHPIAFNPTQRERFRGDVTAILHRLNIPVSAEQFIVAVGAISEALMHHNESIATLIGSQSSELQNMIVMLTQSIRFLGSASDESTRNLEEIAGQLKQASTLEDVSLLRVRLGQCLGKLKEEAARQNHSCNQKLQALSEKLAESQRRLVEDGVMADIDPITGFAGRRSAEAAIQEAIASNSSYYVAVAVLEGMRSINCIFGYKMGDDILCEFAARLAAHFPAPDAMFRWNGPTIVSLLRRPEPIQVIRIDVGRAIADAPTSRIIANRSRNAFVNSTVASLIIPVAAPADKLFAQIDEFVATRVQEKKP